MPSYPLVRTEVVSNKETKNKQTRKKKRLFKRHALSEVYDGWIDQFIHTFSRPELKGGGGNLENKNGQVGLFCFRYAEHSL